MVAKALPSMKLLAPSQLLDDCLRPLLFGFGRFRGLEPVRY
jgi:hypothetical protein